MKNKNISSSLISPQQGLIAEVAEFPITQAIIILARVYSYCIDLATISANI